MTVKLLTLKPRQDVIADIEEIRTTEETPKIVGYQLTHPYAITLSRIEDDETKLSVNISRAERRIDCKLTYESSPGRRHRQVVIDHFLRPRRESA